MKCKISLTMIVAHFIYIEFYRQLDHRRPIWRVFLPVQSVQKTLQRLYTKPRACWCQRRWACPLGGGERCLLWAETSWGSPEAPSLFWKVKIMWTMKEKQRSCDLVIGPERMMGFSGMSLKHNMVNKNMTIEGSLSEGEGWSCSYVTG